VDAALEARNLRVRIGETPALRGLDLLVARGEALGLLGTSGSGKSVTLRAALGLVAPEGGSIRVLGMSPRLRGPALRARVGWVPDEGAPPGWMSAEEAGTLAAAFHRKWDEGRYEGLLEAFRVPRGRPVATFSRGERTRLWAALALARRPEVLLLDDPAPGEGEEARALRQEVRDWRRRSGATVVVAARSAAGLEGFLDSVAILQEGRCTAQCRVEELERRYRRVVVDFPRGFPPRFDLEGCVRLELEARRLTAVLEGFRLPLLDRLRALGATDVRVTELGLEEAVRELARQSRGGGPA
jgi:ABC-2 type transport system ATP-binding protein